MTGLMAVAITDLGESHPANGAGVGFLPRVGAEVFLQIGGLDESGLAQLTLVGLLAGVRP